MTDKNFDENQFPESAEGRSEGSDAQASGPVPQNPDSTEAKAAEGSDETPDDGADDLTVDDILGATQTGEAAAEDAVLADLESTLLNDLSASRPNTRTTVAAPKSSVRSRSSERRARPPRAWSPCSMTSTARLSTVIWWRARPSP